MFGLGKSKEEKLALKIERIMMTIEMASQKGNHDVVLVSINQLSSSLQKLNSDTDWDELQLLAFLTDRGLVKSLKDISIDQWADNILN